MLLSHVWGLFADPQREWKAIRKERCTVTRCYCSHVLILAAIPALAGFVGTAYIGWQIGAREPIRLTAASAAQIAVVYYFALLAAVFTVGKLIQWMSETYGARQALSQCVALAAYSATPLFLIGLMQLYPLLWLNLLIGLPALAYTVYLLYSGVPVMMGISKERGFLFASAVLAVGLVMLVGLLAATVILWNIGLGPAFTD
jgi:hypothetical protein